MARNVIFVAPFPIETTMRFVRAASRIADVRLLGVCQTPPQGDAARLYDDIVTVERPLDADCIMQAIEVLRRRHGQPHRLIGILEPLMVQLAQAREHFGIAGTRPKVADLFRDKGRMKDALRAAGLPVARHKVVASERDALSFAEDVGFPIIIKPPAGMGAKATFRVSNLDELRRAVVQMGATKENPMLAEELLRGREHSLETITLGGEARVWSVSNYLPTCLDVIENDWIKWATLLPRELDAPVYDRAREMGVRAIKALGLDSGMTHMEWFERHDGSLAIGEIAQRPPGANITLMTGLVHGIDPYRAWARAVIDGELDAPWERKYAVGCAYLRGAGRGRVARVTGVGEVQRAFGKWVVEAKLPSLGAPKSDSYEGDGYIVVRHEQTDAVRTMLKTMIETIGVDYR